jgi:hypothetical protein
MSRAYLDGLPLPGFGAWLLASRAHHKLDYDLLKHINKNPKVVEIRGTYMGRIESMGASYESFADIGIVKRYWWS